jgi:hypothetical protein
MISPEAARLVIRHFDAIDQCVSRRTCRKRPWLEVAITSYLCDLLDEDTQLDTGLSYSIADLNRDLSASDGLLDLTLSIDTHEYDARLERWVTQADLGLILRFEDHLLPGMSWSTAWLLQAKRVYPDSRNPLRYSELSRLAAVDGSQHARMARLNEVIGLEFIRYMFYCPRPEFLDEVTRRKLFHLRRQGLLGQIFDYTLGLELHDAVNRPDSSLAAGIFVSRLDDAPDALGDIHSSIFGATLPLSWFVVSHFFSSGPSSHFGQQDRSPERQRPIRPGRRGASSDPDDWAHGIVRGDPQAIERLVGALGDEVGGPWPVLPAHTLTLEFGVGSRLDPEHRRIRTQG